MTPKVESSKERERDFDSEEVKHSRLWTRGCPARAGLESSGNVPAVKQQSEMSRIGENFAKEKIIDNGKSKTH